MPGGVGPVAGALLGAVYGVQALPVELLAGLELGWTADTLARDFAAQLLYSPGPSGWTGEDVDPHWIKRYPGW